MTVDGAVETWTGEKLFGFRGTSVVDGEELARLQVVISKPRTNVFILDVPTSGLPYLPDMSPGSDFKRSGNWHHYPVESGYEVVIRGRELSRVSLNGVTVYDRNLDN